MEGRKRTVQVKFYVTEEERRLIREKMKLIPTRNMAAYLRKMAIDGYVVHIDTTDIRAQTAELQKIGVNINQIARRLNSMGPLYTQDVADTQIVNDEQVVLVKAGDKVGPVIGEHPCQAVQDGGKVRHQHRHIPVKQGVGDTTGEKGLAGSHIPKQQQAGVVLVCLLPVLHIGAGLVHQRILAVVVGKGVVVQIAVLQALGLPALDTLHAALPFLGSLAALIRFMRAAHSGQYLARLEPGVNSALHTAHLFAFIRWNSAVSSSLSCGNTAARNHLHNRE